MKRRVVLLETSERSGLVASLAEVCKTKGGSIEISTGPGHVLICFEATETVTDDACKALKEVTGIHNVIPYIVVGKEDFNYA